MGGEAGGEGGAGDGGDGAARGPERGAGVGACGVEVAVECGLLRVGVEAETIEDGAVCREKTGDVAVVVVFVGDVVVDGFGVLEVLGGAREDGVEDGLDRVVGGLRF